MTSSGASCEVAGNPSSVTDTSVQPLAANGTKLPLIVIVLASRLNVWQTEPPPSTLIAPSLILMAVLTTRSPTFSHKDGISLFETSNKKQYIQQQTKEMDSNAPLRVTLCGVAVWVQPTKDHRRACVVLACIPCVLEATCMLCARVLY